MADPRLVDTNILLRLVRRNHAEYALADRSLRTRERIMAADEHR
jgi:hypothetical protein